jgi:hypothetical protein
MHGAKARGRCPEAYYLYVEEHATPAVDKARREKGSALLSIVYKQSKKLFLGLFVNSIVDK